MSPKELPGSGEAVTKKIDMGYEGKVVVVTGAGRGIGRCVAEMYCSEGAKVVLAEKDASAGETAAREIVSKGGDASFIRTDVSIPFQVTAMIMKAAEVYGTVDIVVNNVLGAVIFE